MKLNKGLSGLFRVWCVLALGWMAAIGHATGTAALTPSFSTGTGTYYAPVAVTINEATSCAVVYYTTDGTVPTTASAVYSAPVTISATTKLQAMAECPGGVASAVASATYTVSAPYAPTFSTGTGNYYAPVTVTVHEGTSCAVVYYTTDGTTPTTASAVYSTPLTFAVTTTLKAISECPGGGASPVTTATYTVRAPYAPTFSTGTGNYYAPVTVTVSEGTSCAVVYYTTDGSVPTTSSPVYSAPVTIAATTTLMAMSECPGGGASPVTTATYTMKTPNVPTFSTGTGTYYTPVSITISESTSCAVVYYTTDGTTPTTASAVYSAPLALTVTTTLKALSACPGGGLSAVVTATYTLATSAAPTFSIGTGTHYSPFNVTVSEATKCAVVYYTTDGSAPTTASAVYSAPLTIGVTTTLKAFSQCAGGNPSAVTTASYTVNAPVAPTFSTGTGTHYAPFSVTVSESTSCAVVYYTTDGTTPTKSSAVYSAPLAIGVTTTLKAASACAGGGLSAVTAATYTVNAPNLPTFSKAAGTYYTPINVTISESTSCGVVYYTTDGTTPTTASTRYTAALAISATTTLQAIAACTGGGASTVVSALYTIKTPNVPVFSVGTGTHYSPFALTVTESTACASVYYTTNGTTPTTASTKYTAPLTISTTTLQAIAVCTGGSPSAVVSATYTVTAPLAPTFSTGTGTHYSPFSVTVSEGTSCASVYYTTDGTTPTTASTKYTVPLTISTTTTLQAISACTGGSASTVTSATYTVSAPLVPTFSTGTGTHYAPFSVTVSEGTSCASVYYTTDGSTPTTASTLYTTALPIAVTTTLQAIAQCAGGSPSAVASATYTVTTPAVPVLSVGSGSFARSVTVSITEGTPGAKVYYTINGTTPTTASTVYSAPIVFSNTSLFSVARTLTAVAVYPGGSPSAAVSANYTILSETTPVGTTNSSSKFMGINVIDLQNNSKWPLATSGAVRFWNWANLWVNLNPSRGVYSWTNLDNEIAVAQSHGVPMLFTFGEVPPWAITQGLGVTSAVRSGGVVTVTTAAPHALYYNPTYLPADQTQVVIAGVGDASFNGTFSLTGTPSATTLQYVQAGTDASSSGGTLSAVCSGDSAPVSCAQAPMHLSDWQDFVTALMNHVGPNVIHTWEGWNEANISNTWRGDPAYLVQMVNAAHGIIHGVDPAAVVLSPSATINFETPQECATMDARCGSTWMRNWLAAGGATAIDGVAIHTYPMVGEGPEQVQGQLTLLKVAMNQNGVGSLPIVDTESSWGLNTLLPDSNDEVAYLGRHFLLLHSMGVQASYWYAYDDSLWGTMWNSTTGLNPAGEAYNYVYKWIVGSTVTKPCAPIALGSTTYSCSYTRAGGYTGIAVWDTSGSGTFTVPTGYVQYRDLYGDLIAVGGATVPLTASPILLENKSVF